MIPRIQILLWYDKLVLIVLRGRSPTYAINLPQPNEDVQILSRWNHGAIAYIVEGYIIDLK